MLETLRDFTLTKLHSKINLSELAFQQWLTEVGLLHKKRTCICGQKMRKEKRQQYGIWRCTTFRKTKGVLVGGTSLHSQNYQSQQIIC
jgi:hypothetical protein